MKYQTKIQILRELESGIHQDVVYRESDHSDEETHISCHSIDQCSPHWDVEDGNGFGDQALTAADGNGAGQNICGDKDGDGNGFGFYPHHYWQRAKGNGCGSSAYDLASPIASDSYKGHRECLFLREDSYLWFV